MEIFLSLLKKFKALHISDAINFELMTEIFISHHSTALEGSGLTEEETRILLIDGLTAKGKPLIDHDMVRDHQQALLATIDMARERKDVSPRLIQSVNSFVMKTTGTIISSLAGNYDSSKGEWRKSPVHAGARYFPDFKKVPDMVNQLCKEVNNRIKYTDLKEIYDLAYDFHFKLVSIHPFADGNGRTSRLMMNYVLSYHNQPLAIVFNEDKLEYINALEETRKKENIQIFRDFMYGQQEKYLEKEIDKVLRGKRSSDITKFLYPDDEQNP